MIITRYYFVIIVITISFAFNFLGSYLRASYIKESLQLLEATSTKNITTLYEKYLWAGYGKYIKGIYDQPKQLWENNAVMESFKNIAIDLNKNKGQFALKIYSPSGNLLVETHPLQIEELNFSILDKVILNFLSSYNKSDQENFQNTINSKTINTRVIRAHINNQEEKTVIAKSLSPILNPEGDVEAIIEVYFDISKQWHQLLNLQLGVTVTILLIIGTIFLVLTYTSVKAQRIIDKQIEINVELENAKRKAEETSKQKSMFLANMSHELRTPLNSIIGFSDIIRNESFGEIGNPQYKEYGTDIYESGTHLLSLINDILDFSKADADKLQVEEIEVDVIKMLKQCVRIVQPKAIEANLNLIDNSVDEHHILIADPKRLKQVFLNILSNAIKFTSEGGEIKINTTIHPGNPQNITIDFIDSGVGIAPKDIAKVMQPFTQVESTLTKKHAGTGLGLPLTKKLVELMNGKFVITSEIGLGTTVSLTFPLNK